MKNLKKVFAVILALTLLLSMYIPATVSAADTFKYSNEASYLNRMGMYDGISSSSFQPDLGSTVTKEMGVVLIMRALGQKAYALSLTEAQIENMLKIFSDADQISSWARPYVAAGISLGAVNGNLDFTFTPKAEMDSKMLAKLILINADYVVDEVGYQSGPYLLRDAGAFTLEQAQYFISKAPITRDDLVGMIYNSLKLKNKVSGVSMIQNLIDKGIVTEAIAISTGAYGKDLMDKATAAVVAYENAPYTTDEQIAATAALKTAADTLIGKLGGLPGATTGTIATLKTSLTNRVAAQVAKITNQTIVNTLAKADAAVAAYEAAPYATPAQVTAAAALKATANGFITTLNGFTTATTAQVAAKNALIARIAVMDAKIVDKTTQNVIDAATSAVAAYEAAPYSTPAEVAAGALLKKAAEDLIAQFATFPNATSLQVTTVRDALNARIAAQLAKVNALANFDLAANSQTQITVSFNKAINPDTVKGGLTVTLNGTAYDYTTNFAVAADGKSVNIYLGGVKAFNTTVAVTPKASLVCADGTGVVATTKTAAISDITAPSFSDAAATTGKTAVTVYASEQLNINAALATSWQYLDGSDSIKVLLDGSLAIAKVSTTALGVTTITFYNDIAAGAHTLTLSGYKDMAGNAGAEKTVNFTMAYDSTAPAATGAVLVDTRKVEVTFSENIAAAAAGSISVNGSTAGTLSVSGNKVTFVLTNSLDAAALLGVPVNVVAGKVTDAWGNAAAAASYTLSLTATDTTAPTVASYVYGSDALKVTFSEAVIFPEATTLNIKNGSTVVGTLAVAAGTYATSVSVPMSAGYTSADVNSMTVTLSSDKGVIDASLLKNALAASAITYTFTTADKKAPSITSASYVGTKIYITYSEAITNLPAVTDVTITETAVNKAFNSYTKAAMTLSGNTLVLSSDSSLAAVTAVTIPGVKDLAGNAVAGTTTPAFTSPAALAFSTAVAKATNVFEVTIPADYTITSVPAYNAVKILAGGVDTGMLVTNIAVAGNKMTITTTGAIKANAKVGAGDADVTVSFAAGSIKTSFDQTFGGTTATVTDAIKATQAALTFVKDASIGTFSFTFDEAVAKVGATTDAQLAAGIEVYTTVQLLPGIDYTAAVVGGNVVVTLTAPAVVTSAKIVRPDFLQDVVGNAVIVK